MSIKLSIVIPCYNGGSVIRKTIGTVIKQLDSDMELILIDNGSIDNTRSVITSIASGHSNIKTITYDVNKGVSFARNDGISRATGKYIIFYDCDDIVPAGACRKLLQKAIECDADIVAGNYEQYEGNRCYDKSKIELLPNYYESLMSGSAIWNKIFKTEMIRENNIHYKEYNYGEDSLFLAETIKFAKKIEIIKALVYRRVVNQSGYSNLTKQYHLDCLREYVNSGIETYTINYNNLYPESSIISYHLKSIHYLWMDYWPHLPKNEKERGFEEIKRYVNIREWDGAQLCNLERMFGTNYETLQRMTLFEYLFELSNNGSLANDCAFLNDSIIKMLLDGKISIKQVVKYNGAWAIGFIRKITNRINSK